MSKLFLALRLLLGAILVITAVEYFLPFILPIEITYSWEDPVAARLMDMLEQSGLLAVGKFIHLAGGLLLLVNRKTPFALAALMPVNVCALFIGMFVEGDAALAIFGLVIVAVNGLLMLAILPSYARMLSAGELADGEGAEPGQNYNSLFVNPMAGAPTKAYLGGGVALAVALYAYWDVIPFANGTTGLYTLIFPGAVFAIGLVMSLVKKPS